MNQATVYFHAELNFFLPSAKRHRPCLFDFKAAPSIKDMIESIGVLHPEVELIVVNGQSVDFSYMVQSGDKIDVYPLGNGADLKKDQLLRAPLIGDHRFVLDVHLGRLARYLRMLGFDTLYRNDYEDETLAQISADEERILLTRDRGLLKRSIVVYGYYLRATNPRKQLGEILTRYKLNDQITPFKRCLDCNGLVEATSKAAIIDQLSEDTRAGYDEFRRCQQCERVFWKGPHYHRMTQFIDSVLNPL